MRPRSALIADDCLLTRSLHTELLRGLGYAVTSVDSGEAAAREARRLAEAEGRPYDLTLIDFDMPDGDGPTAARAIRKLLPAGSGTILCVTGHPIAEVEATCFAAGFDAVVRKPLTHDALAAWVAED